MKTLFLSTILMLTACKEQIDDPTQPIPRNTATIEHYSWMNDYATHHNLMNVVCRNMAGLHEIIEVCTAQDSLGATIRVAFWGRQDAIPFSITKDPL
jgi:hypothetical protein